MFELLCKQQGGGLVNRVAPDETCLTCQAKPDIFTASEATQTGANDNRIGRAR